MPVTFNVSPHPAEKVGQPFRPVRTVDDLLLRTWGEYTKTAQKKEILQSSFVDSDFTNIECLQNGFIYTMIDAYNKHHHLVLRPDDVWIAILGQFNFFVNANAEALRTHFVAHEGKKKLVVRTAGNRYTVDFGSLASQMANLVHENVVDKELKDWILPDFSTTTKSDTVTCAVLMMATLKAYFSYGIMLDCGIPSVTLEGKRSDWAKLLSRVDKLEGFGKEPSAWVTLLRPILSRFVSAFDGEPDLDFWGKICHHHNGGSGPTYLSGWITAFCVWSNEGKWQGPSLDPSVRMYIPGPCIKLELEGAKYGVVDTDKIPTGFCEVDVDLDDNGEHFDCMMVSGHMTRRTIGENLDTLHPMPGWFMFVKESSKNPELVAVKKSMDGKEKKRGKFKSVTQWLLRLKPWPFS